MGQSQSTAATVGADTPSASTKHVFTASTPINFSSELIESLSNSSETNSTRAKSLDLHIQQRVHEELARLQSSQDSALKAAREKILSTESTDHSETKSEKRGVKDAVKAKLPEALGGKSGDAEQQKRERTSQSVAGEIERLKKELGQRKVLKDLPKELESARQDVIGCLRVNDRRPLDCWKEVEVFKREVRRLEEEFVGKVL